jgi:predicted nucleotidyltransferase
MSADYKSGVVRRLAHKGLIKPPSFVEGSTVYETMMGSVAYGVSSDTSDVDIYGFCIPPKDYIFPHLAGHIAGFSTQIQSFDQYQEHHIKEKDHNKEYDVNIYSIIKYFRLCMDNNPNMIDSLFTATNMVLSSSKVSNMVRDQRKMFLHKGSWHKFKGYAYGQMHKMKIKDPDPSSVRYEMVMKHGYDVKFAYHVVRLLDEVEQILTEGDIDLMRNREQLKSIRRGEWKMEDIESYFARKEKDLETVYTNSKLQHRPPEIKITQLLIDCLEEHFGDLSAAVSKVDSNTDILKQIKELVKNV